MDVRTEDLDKAIAEVIGTFDGVEEISAEQREGIVNHCCSGYYLAYAVRSIRWDIRLTRRKPLF